MSDSDAVITLREWTTGLPGISILVAAGLVGVWRRTGSSHLIWYRLWIALFGERRRDDTPVERFHDEQMEMFKFRALTNIAVRTPAQVAPVIEWIRRHDLSPTAVAACGHYFDVASPGLTSDALRMNSRRLLLPSTLLCGFSLMAIALLTAATQEKALLQFKDTGHWFTLDAEFASPIGEPGFHLIACDTPPEVLARQSGFQQKEVILLCEGAKKHEIASYVRHDSQSESDLRSFRHQLSCLRLIFPHDAAANVGRAQSAFNAEPLPERIG